MPKKNKQKPKKICSKKGKFYNSFQKLFYIIITAIILPIVVLLIWRGFETYNINKSNRNMFNLIIEKNDSFDKKIDDLNLLIESAAKVNDKLLMADIYCNLGYYYIQKARKSNNILDDYKNGISYYEKSLSFIENMNDEKCVNIKLNISVAYLGMCFYDFSHQQLYLSNAIEYLEEILNNSNLNGLTKTVAKINLSKAYIVKGTSESLEEAYKLTQDIDMFINIYLKPNEELLFYEETQSLIMNNISNKCEIFLKFYEYTNSYEWKYNFEKSMKELSEIDYKNNEYYYVYYNNLSGMGAIEYNKYHNEDDLLKLIDYKNNELKYTTYQTARYYKTLEELISYYSLLDENRESSMKPLLAELKESIQLSNNIDKLTLDLTLLGIEVVEADNEDKLKSIISRYEILVKPYESEYQSYVKAHITYMLSRSNMKAFKLTKDWKYMNEWMKNINLAMSNEQFFNNYMRENPEIQIYNEKFKDINFETMTESEKRKLIEEIVFSSH